MDTINIRERIKPTPTESCFATLRLRVQKYPTLRRVFPWVCVAMILGGLACLIPAPVPLALSSVSASPSADLPRRNEVLHASDGLLSVWNYDTGMGGAVPDCINTVRWWDDVGMHDQVFRGKTRLGWVEAVGFFPSFFGNVYIFVTADKLPTGEETTSLRAFRAPRGATKLEEIERFFPEMPGADGLRTRVDWIWRPYAGMQRRPFEARVNDERREIGIRVTPPPGPAKGDAGRYADECFVLRFNGREVLYQPEGGGVTSARTTARLVGGN